MKIIILGAGQVGSSVAEVLVGEANDISMVDLDSGRLQQLRDRLDIRTVEGCASHPAVLEQAGAQDAEMLLAVTSSDETNMLACRIAASLFHTPTKMARIRDAGYLDHPGLFDPAVLPVDVLISPEQEITDQIIQLLEYPGALQVVEFADGRVRLVVFRIRGDGLLAGHRLDELPGLLPEIETRVVAIYRRNAVLIPDGDTVIQEDDELFALGTPGQLRKLLMARSTMRESGPRRVLIAGGGNIGLRLARSIEDRMLVKVVELDGRRAQAIASRLDRALVLRGDCTSEELLREEEIDQVDVFCALTDSDEANIISAMLARRLGAHKVMALINRSAYVELIQGASIDIAISPQQATIGSLLRHIRRGDVARVHALRHGSAEALEVVAHGSRRDSKLVGRRVEELPLPPGVVIGALVRGEEVLMAHHDTVIQNEDHVILLVTDRSRVREVEQLFQVGVLFL